MRGTLMRLFTVACHQQVLGEHSCNVKAAEAYNALVPRAGVTRQNVKYWRLIFGDDKPNMAKADRELKESRQIQEPLALVGDAYFHPEKKYRSILVIPDQHAPYQHPDAVDFLIAVAARFKPDLVVNLGDELDFHAMSFHDSDPNLDSAGPELTKGITWLQGLAAVFPHQLVCDSNHGSMTFRRAKAHGLPVQLIKSYRDVVFPDGGGDGWTWAESWRVQTPLGPVLFKHQPSGDILGDAAHNACNLMVGHHHGKFEISYTASSAHLYWGAYSGCLIDKDSYAFAYGKHAMRKPVIGCSVIIDGRPLLVPMVLNKEGRWNGSL